MARKEIILPHFNLPHLKLRHKPTAIGQYTQLVLTPLGKQKANSFSMDGPRFDVLSEINENGSCTRAEIANETGMSDNHVKKIITELTRSGYVRVASSEE